MSSIQLPAIDLRIVLTWEDEFADMDLWVVEPTGEKVYYGNVRSAIGGQLLDVNYFCAVATIRSVHP